MSLALSSSVRSALGAARRSGLGVRSTWNDDDLAALAVTLLVAGEFTGSVAVYDAALDEFISLGLSSSAGGETLLVLDGDLYALADGRIHVMETVGTWVGLTNHPGGAVIESAAVWDGRLVCWSGFDLKVYEYDFDLSVWSQLGGATSVVSGTLLVDGADLWSGSMRLEGSTWTVRTDWPYSGAVGGATFTKNARREAGLAQLSPSATELGSGFYTFTDGAWSFVEPAIHNLAGADLVSGYVWTGSDFELNPADNTGTLIATPGNIQNFTHAGAFTVLADNGLFQGSPPVSLSAPDLADMLFAASIGGDLYVVGEAHADGTVYRRDGSAWEQIGQASYPDAPVVDIIGPAGLILTFLADPDDATHLLTSDTVTVEVTTLTIVDCDPATGDIAGGTVVTVFGTGFTGSTVVYFDGVLATGITLTDSTELQCTTPAHAEATVDVTVEDGADTDTLTAFFIYVDR